MEAGAWECGVCGQVNAGWCHKCGRCDLPRPSLALEEYAKRYIEPASENLADKAGTFLEPEDRDRVIGCLIAPMVALAIVVAILVVAWLCG